MKAPKYEVTRQPKPYGYGYGKFHLVEVGSKTTLCSVKLRRGGRSRYAHPVEEALKILAIKERRRYQKKSHLCCKNCINRAQKLRNPLDRLADIPSSENSAELTLFR
jgi:hypothetical protein